MMHAVVLNIEVRARLASIVFAHHLVCRGGRCKHMRTVTISMRLPRDEVARLEKLAKELGTERPTLLKRALRRGAKDLMFEGACQAYRAGEATLSRAAEIADLPLRAMILKLKDADLELSYGVDELERDLRE